MSYALAEASVRAADTERFWQRVDKSGKCWEWTGSHTSAGYGNLRVNGVSIYAHRLAFELHSGPIPEGMHLDHLCRNRGCCNPAHLEAVTPGENIRRGLAVYGQMKTTCINGHDMTVSVNVYVTPRGMKRCRECASHANDRRRLRRRIARAQGGQ